MLSSATNSQPSEFDVMSYLRFLDYKWNFSNCFLVVFIFIIYIFIYMDFLCIRIESQLKGVFDIFSHLRAASSFLALN